MSAIQSVQVFGRKKAATAVAYCKQGRGLIKVNGCPIELLEPEILRLKTFEPVLLLRPDALRERRHPHPRQGRRLHGPNLRH